MKSARKVLILGNSITRHAPAPEIGWHGDWGMAASCEENDYVHILSRRILAVDASAVIKALTIVEWENNFWERGIDLPTLSEARCFGADIIVMRVAENVDDERAVKHDFGQFYARLIQYVNPKGAGAIVCTNCFWERPNVSRQIRSVADANCYLFVDISRLRQDESNMALDQYWHKGVGYHPSDRGMLAIADLIWSVIAPLI